MSENKYVYYAKNLKVNDSRPIPWMAQFFGDEPKTKSFYSIHWCMPNDKPINSKRVGHPPHMHKETEIIFLIGADPYNHTDLGGTVEMCIGENMEPITITETCAIVIPPNTPHGNYRSHAERPFIFIQVQEAAPRTEKFLWNYLTQEQIDSIEDIERWKDTGYED